MLLVLAVAPAWPFASVQAGWEFVVALAVAALLALWAAHGVVTRQFQVRADVVTVALAGLVLWSVAQLVPLPFGMVRVISPGAAAVHETYRPEVAETLPGEAAGAPRPDALPLSVDPDATRTFAVRLTALLLVYAAARNWLASPAALRRLAWVATANGLALAVLALAQFFSSRPDTIFWTREVGGSVFGPFVNRNHFPDFVAGCLGLGVGLMLTLRTEPSGGYRAKNGNAPLADRLLTPFKYLDQPWPLAAAGAVAVMAAGILFSLSRGGVLAAVVAGVGCALIARRKAGDRPAGVGGWAVGVTAVLAVALAGWFGWEPVRARFATLLAVKQADDRTELWRDSARAAAGFWAVGSGSGTFLRVETLGRTDGPSFMTNDHAHNEYLEAAVEGGAVRVALTGLLVGGVLVAVGRGVLRQRDRPGGTLLLGAWFGLAAVAAHAVTDFGIHLPAVAVFVAILAGYAMGVSHDTEPHRVRTKVRVRVRQDAPPPPVPAAAVEHPPRPIKERHGFTAVAGAMLVAVTGLAVAADTWTRARSEWLLDGAEAFRRSDAPNRVEGRIAYLTARTRVRPDSPAVWLDLAQARIDAGSPADIRAALAALRTARDNCPLYPEVQFRLGLFARSFETGDPPLAYLERAKRLLVMDADVWYACGVEALRSGDEPTAWANFRHSLELSGRRLKPILAAVGLRLSPDRLAARVLPDEPTMLLAAAEQLYPDPVQQAASRKPFLERAAAAKDRPADTPEPVIAAARALGELGQLADAEATWRRAVKLVPGRIDVRDTFARWLEDEERYAAAVTELEWLTDRRPDDTAYRDRLMVARHAAVLQAAIAGD